MNLGTRIKEGAGITAWLFACCMFACGSDETEVRAGTVAALDSGPPVCKAQREGCTCTPGTDTSVICSIKTLLENGDTLCEGGALGCQRNGVWGGCVGNGQTSVLKK